MKNRLLLGTLAIGLSTFGSQVYGWEEDCCRYEESFCPDDHFFATAQYLLWSTDYSLPIGFKYTEGTTTGSGSTSGVTTTNTTVSGAYFQPHPKWSSGVRLGFGWERDDEVDVRGYWTGYRNRTTKTIPTTQSLFISGIINDMSDDTYVGGSTSATGNYKLNYNIADLEVGKTFSLTHLLAVRPFIGLRGAWIHQDNLLNFSGFAETVDTTVVDFPPQSAAIRHHTAGVGPRVGFETTWGNWCGFSLLGNFSASLVFAEPKTRFEFLTAFVTTAPVTVMAPGVELTTQNVILNDDYWQLIPNLQAQLGVNWSTDFYNGKYKLDVFAAWEANFWWEASTIVVIHRGLGLQGLTAGMNLSF